MNQTTLNKFKEWCRSAKDTKYGYADYFLDDGGFNGDEASEEEKNDIVCYINGDFTGWYTNDEGEIGLFTLSLDDSDSHYGLYIRPHKRRGGSSFEYSPDNKFIVKLSELNEENFKIIRDWLQKHTDYPPFPLFTSEEFYHTSHMYIDKDFIYKVKENAKTVQIEEDYDTIDEFFNPQDYKYAGERINITTIDTHLPIISIEHNTTDKDMMLKYIVNLGEDTYHTLSIFNTKEQFRSLITDTIADLKSRKEFIKYAEDLESCL
ncbi:MAG: hypothetical protein VZS44_12040 [Bacilli bacterium]|nr:hypothetical protein [Bacilli bacterium]